MFLIFCYARKSSVQFGIKREARLARKIAVLVSSNFILFTLPTVLLLVYVYNFSDFLLNMVRSFHSMRSLLTVGSWVPVTCFSLNALVNPFSLPVQTQSIQKRTGFFSLCDKERLPPYLSSSHGYCTTSEFAHVCNQ